MTGILPWRRSAVDGRHGRVGERSSLGDATEHAEVGAAEQAGVEAEQALVAAAAQPTADAGTGQTESGSAERGGESELKRGERE